MHESSLAKQLLDLSLAQAARAPGARVRVIRGRVAETETLSGDSLELHFRAHARGTAAEGARLEVELVHVRARCRSCGQTYLPEHHALICPGCASTDAEELEPTGLFLSTIDVEDTA
jgi:hydrogenase nickel incorporation protein HypA/HybF